MVTTLVQCLAYGTNRRPTSEKYSPNDKNNTEKQ